MSRVVVVPFMIAIASGLAASRSCFAADAKVPTTMPTRSPDELRKALAALLQEARGAAEKAEAKEVVLLSTRIVAGGAARVGPFVQQEVMTAFDGGPAIAPPPESIKAPPAVLNPASLSRLNWGKGGVPLALVVAPAARPAEAVEVTLTLLDGKAQHWQGSLKLSKAEVAALPAVPPVNAQVLKFALERRGQTVGNGECWTLADEALKSAKARHPDTYVWGRKLAAGEDVLPGDIVQFTSVRLEDRRGWSMLGTPGHTAIVRSVKSPGVYDILHQNFGEAGRKVSDLTIDVKTKTAGEIVIYRPLVGK